MIGYSTEFIRGFLSLVAIVATIAVVGAGANELFNLGLAEDGYPGIGAEPGEGVGFGSFCLQLGIIAIASGGLSAYLEGYRQ